MGHRAIFLSCTAMVAALLMGASFVRSSPLPPSTCSCKPINITEFDKAFISGALNLEYLEAEYFLGSVFGYGLDTLDPQLSEGGPAPIGVQKAKLEKLYYTDIITQIGLQEIGHLRHIKTVLGPEYSFARPLLNLSQSVWAKTMDMAVGKKLKPPFNPYANSLNYLLSAYTIPYVGLTTYVGGIADITGTEAKRLVTRLLAIEAGQDAIIRTELYRRKDEQVVPYNYTTAEFTAKISTLRNALSQGFVDEGVEVPAELGAEGMITGNILAGDEDSAAYIRTPAQFFATVYLSGNAAIPGGFYPEGGSGVMAQSLLYP